MINYVPMFAHSSHVSHFSHSTPHSYHSTPHTTPHTTPRIYNNIHYTPIVRYSHSTTNSASANTVTPPAGLIIMALVLLFVIAIAIGCALRD